MPAPLKHDATARAAVGGGESGGDSAGGAAARGNTGRGIRPWLPAFAALLLAPAATWITTEYFVLPRIRTKIAAQSGGAPAVAAPPGDKSSEHGNAEGSPAYEFKNIVVNLAGTAGTRYLKTTFLVTGPEANLKAAFEAAKPRLTDATLNVLSSLSLADLEEPGARNVIREKLVLSYNQVLGRKVADQVYFSDFVIQ